MGGSRKQAELSLLAKVDEQTIQRSISHLRDLQNAERGVATAATQQEIAIDAVNDTTRAYINSVRQSYTASRQDIENRRRTIQSLDQEAAKRREVADAAETQARSTARASQQGNAGKASGGTDFGRVGRGVSSVAAVLPGGAGDAARALADIVGVMDDLPVAIAEVKPALAGLTGSLGGLAAAGLAGIALAALALAIQKFIKDLNDAQESLTLATDAQVRYFELIETGTAEEIQTELKRAEVARNARQRVLEALEAEQARLGVLGQIAKVLGLGPAKEIERLSEEIEKLNFQIDPLERALNSTEVQSRSAAQAAEQQAAQMKASTQTAETATRAETQRTKAIEQATVATRTYAQALRDIVTGVVEQQQNAAQESAELQREYNEERQRMDRDFQQQQLDDQKQAQRDQARQERRAAFDRLVAMKQRELDEFDMLLRGEFAGVSRSRREEQAQAEIDRYQTEFEAQEKLIEQQERYSDQELARQRQIAALQSRIAQAREVALQKEAQYAQQVVQAWLQARGIAVNVANLSAALVQRIYESILRVAGSGYAGAPQFGGSFGGGSTSTSTNAFGTPFGGRAPAFGGAMAQGTGGTAPAITQNNNFYGSNPRETARAVDERMRRMLGTS